MIGGGVDPLLQRTNIDDNRLCYSIPFDG